MSMNIRFEDNSPKFKSEWGNRKKKITYAVGLKWQSICSQLITRLGIIDSGRLRSSLTFITNDKVGGPITRSSESKGSDYLKGSSGNDGDLIVGSNVEYASKQELNNKKGAFIKPSIIDFREEYKNITKSIMNE